MSLMQAFGIALAAVVVCAVYLIGSFMVSDFVQKRSGSLDLGVMAFVIMIGVPVVTALIFFVNKIGVGS